MTTEHSEFVIGKRLPGSPAHAFRFFADPALKAAWTACHPDWTDLENTTAFRVGGTDVIRSRAPAGTVHSVRATYYDIRPGERIVYGYGMETDGVPVSASIVTLTFRADGPETVLTWTEQMVVLDRQARTDERTGGTEWALDRLVAAAGAALTGAH